jgi:hypothetical protein
LYDTVLTGGRTNVTVPPVPPPAPAPAPPAALAPATPMPRKAIAAAVIILGLAGGGAYLYSRGKAPSPASRLGAVSPDTTARPSGQLADPAPAEQMKPVASDASDTDASPPADSALSATDSASAGAAHSSPRVQPAKTHDTPTKHDSSNPPAPPPDANPAPNAAPAAPPAQPAASAAELDEARQRFIRLRSKALALKSSLAELRQRLASQGLSVNADAVEAEGNMDSYMLEADRALQAGDVQAAGTNMDRAEHETKKIAALFGR